MERDAEGRTCLHHCFSWGWSNVKHRHLAGIIFLIKHGADVYAKDTHDRSISDMAYKDFRGDSSEDTWRGSSRGDVWDFCLAVTGYTVSEFRQGHPRKANYGTNYTRQDFEELWAGNEHLCPYYYDAEDEPADPVAPADDESEEEWATTDSEDGGSDVMDLDEE